MPHTNFAPSSIALPQTPARLSARDLLRGLPGKLMQWRRRSKERMALSELDARMLADIGITRATRDAECAKSFWQA